MPKANPFFRLVFRFCLISFTKGQIASTINGCISKNSRGQLTVVPNNETSADDNWWYQCLGTNLVARGCVVNGQRYNVGETFGGYLDNFYGQCELVDDKYLKTTILGCVDRDNNQVEPGHVYILDQHFWANCTSTRKTINKPGLGNVDLDVVGRKIIGCNDGTYDMINNGDNYVMLVVTQPLLAGLGLICQVGGAFPVVQPIVCVVANGTVDQTYLALRTNCYASLSDYLYYCLIVERNSWNNGTLEYGWEMGWNASTTENLAYLKSNNFHDCENQSQNGSVTIPPSTKRAKRFVSTNLHNASGDRSGTARTERYHHLSNWLEASSKLITVN